METQNNNTGVENVGALENNYQIMTPLIKYLLVLVLGMIFGVALGIFIDPTLSPSFSNYKKGNAEGYMAGFNSAKEIVERSTVGGFFKSQKEIRNISGTITAIKENVLTVHSQEINNPFDGKSITDRNVTVATSTKIFEIKNKTEAEYKLEVAEFLKKKYPKEVADNLYPVPYNRISIDLSTLKVGSLVAVVSLENIKNVKDFTAIEVQLQPSLTTLNTASSTIKK